MLRALRRLMGPLMGRVMGPGPDLVRAFQEVFPGRCALCSFHRWARREGGLDRATPPHLCPEADDGVAPPAAEPREL